MGSSALRVAGKKYWHYYSGSFPFAELESIIVNVSGIKMSIFLVFLKSISGEQCQNHDVHQLVDTELHFNLDSFIFYAEIKHYFEVISSH